MGSRRGRLAWVVLAVSMLVSPLAAGAPKSRPSPSPTETPIDLDAPMDLPANADGVDLNAVIEDAPTISESSAVGEGWKDSALGVALPSPGPEWVRISPVPEAPGARAVFVHARGEKVRALFAIGIDTAPEPKDPAGYAKRSFDSLSQLGFKILKKGPVTLGTRTGFAIAFITGTGLRRYEQYYVPGPKGSLVVLTFQAPTAIFDAEVGEFRTAAKAIQTKEPGK